MKLTTVNDYIKQAPLEVQPKLKQLRSLIQKLAPDAEESISYMMPYYEYHGRLVYFANMKNYLGLYIPPPIIENHKEELEPYVTTKSAIHFPNGQELPVRLIKKLIRARMKHNEAQTKK